jgi:hypothetical protein
MREKETCERIFYANREAEKLFAQAKWTRKFGSVATRAIDFLDAFVLINFSNVFETLWPKSSARLSVRSAAVDFMQSKYKLKSFSLYAGSARAYRTLCKS